MGKDASSVLRACWGAVSRVSLAVLLAAGGALLLVWSLRDRTARAAPLIALGLAAVAGALAVLIQRRWGSRERQRQAAQDRAELERQLSVGVLEDLTRQERAERAWRESEERLALLLEATEDGIWDWQIPTDEMYLSPRCARMLGYEPEEVPDAAAVRNLVHPDDRAQASRHIQAHLDGETATLSYEVRMKTRSGAWRWIQNRAKVVRHDPEGRPIRMVGAFTDVTEKHMLQSRLLLADRMASVGTVAAGVAHEINNPLAYVVANLGFAREALVELTSPGEGAQAVDPELLFEARQAVEEAREGTDRVRAIVRDLRTFSRSDDDAHGPADVNKVLQSSLHFAAHETKSRARVVAELPHLPPVLASSSRLGQVFLNLVLNAAQAIPEGHPEENEIRVSSRLDGSKVVVEIRDTGSGMPPEVQARIFEPFFTTKRAGEGTGLGLAICHGIVTGLGGQIEVESQVGRGSLFRVLLPVASVPRGWLTPRPAVLELPPAELAGRRGRVLVVDDEPRLGKSIERLLVPDHEVIVCTSARDALALFAQGDRFDLVLCDLMMPDVTGMDFHEQLKQLQPAVAERMVFITGGAFTPRAKQFLEVVPNRRIEKPFTPESIHQLLRDALLAAGAP